VSPDEAKPPKRQARQPAKPEENGSGEFRSEAKSDTKPDAKPETKPEAKSDVDIAIPPRNRRREAKPPQPSLPPAEANRAPAAVVVQPDSSPPAPVSAPSPEPSPALETPAPPAAPADAASGDNAPVPRDNIPD
jgi:hypothetical protein